jgi:hypothetical protein
LVFAFFDAGEGTFLSLAAGASTQDDPGGCPDISTNPGCPSRIPTGDIGFANTLEGSSGDRLH